MLCDYDSKGCSRLKKKKKIATISVWMRSSLRLDEPASIVRKIRFAFLSFLDGLSPNLIVIKGIIKGTNMSSSMLNHKLAEIFLQPDAGIFCIFIAGSEENNVLNQIIFFYCEQGSKTMNGWKLPLFIDTIKDEDMLLEIV